jgi:Arc/MetJ-type ribon-helix-helix transcriptional regulator
MGKEDKTLDPLRFNSVIDGKPAVIVRKLLDEGLYSNKTDLIRQAILALHEKRLDLQLKEIKIEEGKV